jgi:outer membrane protein assembly factor BamB
MKRRRSLVSVAILLVATGGTALATRRRATNSTSPRTIGASDWPTFGHDAQHTFAGVTSITPATAPTLAPAWFFPTGDAITANPVVVNDTVYIGSWDGYFYAIDRATGALRWKYLLKQQPAISPSPGSANRATSQATAASSRSAWFEPSRGRPNLVIFAGGYALRARRRHRHALLVA